MLERKLSELYLSGESTVSLAKTFDLDTKTVWEILKNQGVAIRSRKEAAKLALEKERLYVKQHRIPHTGLTPEKAYLLGVLCGDGWIWCNHEPPHQTYQFALQAVDEDFVDEFTRCILKTYRLEARKSLIKSKIDNWRDKFQSRVCSKEVCEDLMKYLPKHKTRTWAVPTRIRKGKPELKAVFIKGFFDSEGSLDVRRINATSINLRGLKGIKSLLEQLSIRSSIPHTRNGIYQLRIQDRASVELFASRVGFTIARKSNSMDKILRAYKLRTSLREHVKLLEPEMKELRKQNISYEKIAQKLGVSVATVWNHT